MTDKLRLSDRQVQNKLAQLKKRGLYNGNVRKRTATKYGRSILKKYMDVLEGKAAVVTVPKKVARAEFQENFRVVRNKVVVPKGQKTEKIVYSKKTKAITSIRKNAQGETYKREFIKVRANNVQSLPALRKNQVYSVPFNRWGKTEYMNFTNKEELASLILQYETKYKGILNQVQLVTYKAPKGTDFDEESEGDE